MLFPSLRAPLVVLGAYAAGVLGVPTTSTTTHDQKAPVSAARDLTRSNPFTQVDAGGTPKDFYANVEDVANIKLPRDLAASHPLDDPLYQSCLDKDKTDILRIIDDSMKYIGAAIRHLQIRGDKPLYDRWFGVPSEARVYDVNTVFHTLWNKDFRGFVYACNCPHPTAYFFFETSRNPNVLHLCTTFWRSLRGDQALILIGAVLRFQEDIGLETTDLGWQAARNLALGNPDGAVLNVDNYLQFITSVISIRRRNRN